jgi:hypothetical protein
MNLFGPLAPAQNTGDERTNFEGEGWGEGRRKNAVGSTDTTRQRKPKQPLNGGGRSNRSRRSRRPNRSGLSAMEVIITLGVTFPIAMALYFLGRDACARLFYIIDSLVSWPFL